jgi:hypothetical protein
MDAAVRSHHTAWIRSDGGHRATPVRYAVSGDTLVTFGDRGPLAGLRRGDHAHVTVHEIAGGPAVASFGVTVQELDPDLVEREAVLELLAHVQLGPDLETVNRRVDEVCHRRRLVALAP